MSEVANLERIGLVASLAVALGAGIGALAVLSGRTAALSVPP
jgi:hypothetical protein